MQTPEEFAWTLYAEEMDFHDHSWYDTDATVRLIAARDEAIRADERAKALAEFEWEERARAASPYSRVEIQRALDTGTWIGERRLVGPWEPTDPIERETDERCDEQPCCRYCGEPGNDCPGPCC